MLPLDRVFLLSLILNNWRMVSLRYPFCDVETEIELKSSLTPPVYKNITYFQWTHCFISMPEMAITAEMGRLDN